MIVMLLPLLLLVSGCCHSFATHAPLPVTSKDNTAHLLMHPQFQVAAAVAPDFVAETLSIITRLEREIANAGR